LKGTIKFDSQGNKGQFQDRLELIFWDLNSTRRFAIVKNLTAIVGNKEDYDLLKPIAPYVPFKQVQRDPIKEFIPGRRPEAIAPVKWVVKFQDYHVEDALKEVLALRSTAEKMRLIKAGFMPLLFQAETHASWFHVLLQLEEHQSA
jgi:helicase MOV-10